MRRVATTFTAQSAENSRVHLPAPYSYQRPEWPNFTWQHARLAPLLGAVRQQQGRVLGQMEARGFLVQADATLQILTLDVLKSNEIEEEHLTAD